MRRLGEHLVNAIHVASLVDIEKVLVKINKSLKGPSEDPRKRIPAKFLREFPELFAPEAATKLPPHRLGINHEVNLQRSLDGQELALPWGPLYNMSREELLVLRKTIRNLLDKGFIQASSSAAAAPVLFVQKPGGSLRFCCDYRALNAITQRDHYLLPLIIKTLHNLADATRFTKLDVIAAFHGIWITKGHEAKTAFRTRYGLFEWTVCPFRLSGTPATFQ